MSSSSPSDLAVTFRSVPRRLREAIGDTPPSATSAITAELNEQIAIAAKLMHTAAEPDAIADAIEAVPADEWDDAVLDFVAQRRTRHRPLAARHRRSRRGRQATTS